MASFTRLSTGKTIRYSEALRRKETGGEAKKTAAPQKSGTGSAPSLPTPSASGARLGAKGPSMTPVEVRPNLQSMKSLGILDIAHNKPDPGRELERQQNVVLNANSTGRLEELASSLDSRAKSAWREGADTTAGTEESRRRAYDLSEAYQKRLQAVKDELQKRRDTEYHQDLQARVAGLESARSAPDFTSTVTRARNGEGWGDVPGFGYDRVRNALSYLSAEAAEKSGKSGSWYSPGELMRQLDKGYKFGQMSDEEKDTFRYYIGRKEYDKADSYLDALERTLTARANGEFGGKVESFSKEHPALGAAANIATWPANIPAALANAGQAAKNAITGEYEPTDTNSDLFLGAKLQRGTSTGVQEWARDKGGDAGAFLAGTGLSIGQNLAQLPLGPLALAGMSASAAGSSTLDALDRGASPGEALAYGGISGAVEAITEKIPLDNLFRVAKEGGRQSTKQIAKNLERQVLAEGTGEALSEVGGNIADTAIMGDRSEYRRYVEKLKSKGTSADEAERKAFKQFYLVNTGLAAAGGALSGGILDVGAQAVGNAAYRGDVRQAMREVSPEARQKLVNAGLRSDPKSTAYKLAVQAVNKTAAGEKVSTNELAKLYIAVERDNRGKLTLTAPEGANKTAPETGTENTRLTVSDEQAYSQTGNRPQIKRSKQNEIAAGNKIVLTNDTEIKSFIQSALGGSAGSVTKAYGKVGSGMADDVYSASNGAFDVEGWYLELVPSDIHHAYKRHLKPSQAGNIALSEQDFLNIPDYIDSYDDILECKTHKSGDKTILFGKKINGYSVIVEMVSKSRHALQFKTMWGVDTQTYENQYKNGTVHRPGRSSVSTNDPTGAYNDALEATASEINIHPEKAVVNGNAAQYFDTGGQPTQDQGTALDATDLYGPDTLTEGAAEHTRPVEVNPEDSVGAAQAERERQQAEFRVIMQEQLAEIHKIDSSVNSLEDIMNGPGGQQFYDYVQNKGLSFVDAFLLTNFHRLRQRDGDTAREQAQSKDHLAGAGAVRGEESAAVPPAVLALFRELNPGVSDSEFQSYYDKYKKNANASSRRQSTSWMTSGKRSRAPGDSSEIFQPMGDYLKPDGSFDLETAKSDYKEFLQSVPERNRMYLLQSLGAVTFEQHTLEGSAFGYNPDKDVIAYDPTNPLFPQYDFSVVLTHELAHRVDRFFVHSWEQSDFTAAFQAARVSFNANPQLFVDYCEKHDNEGFLSDILSAICEDDYQFEFSHGKGYWQRTGKKERETFANLFSLETYGDEEKMRFMETHFKGLIDSYKNLQFEVGKIKCML